VFTAIRKRPSALRNEDVVFPGPFLHAAAHYRAAEAGGAAAFALPHTNWMKESRPALA
jgi:hypothetical protein